MSLQHFGAVDLEQRVAALHLVSRLGDQLGHAPGERGQHDRARVLVEGDLANGELLDPECARRYVDDAELVHLVGGDRDGIGVVPDLRARLGRRWWGKRQMCHQQREHEHPRQAVAVRRGSVR